MDTLFVTRAKQCDTALSGLSKVVEGIGSQIFWPNLISYLDEEIGGEHCVVWNLSNERMNPVGSASWNGSDQSHRRLVQYTNPNFWRRDPGLSIARKEASDGASVGWIPMVWKVRAEVACACAKVAANCSGVPAMVSRKPCWAKF